MISRAQRVILRAQRVSLRAQRVILRAQRLNEVKVKNEHGNYVYALFCREMAHCELVALLMF